MGNDYYRAAASLWILGVVLLGLFAGRVLSWQNEAATFNKYKRPDQPAATIWDAAFADLRVTN